MEIRKATRTYQELKNRALCIDIETTRFNGEIAVLGAYHPKEGLVETVQLVRGRDLDWLAVRNLFHGCRLILTFNGSKHDLPKIRSQFPGTVPQDVVHIDLYELAQLLNLKAGLKVLEQRFSILREEPYPHWKHKALALWKRYRERGCESSLKALLRYNENDCVNLYPLAEQLIALARRTLHAHPESVTPRILERYEGIDVM